nr:very short patch repair endonuclease [Pseudomonas sp. MWU12-2029]
MVDSVTRSRMMSGIKGKNTKPEVSIRKALHARGFRYRMHVNDLPGKPDLVLPKYKAVVFVHGCFWHGHSCRYFKAPKTRTAFWIDKIQKNRDRDELQVNALLASGWRVLLIWECAVRSAAKGRLPVLMDQIVGWLENGEKYMQIQEKTTE